MAGRTPRSGRRGWDGDHFPPSKPLPVEGGVVTSRQRGPMARSWWSKRFVDVLESYGLGGRMQRGRRYARQGQVIYLEVAPGLVSAQVQGSRPDPYEVSIKLAELTTDQWDQVLTQMTQRLGLIAELVAGRVPEELEAAFSDVGVALFPPTWAALGARCGCPDNTSPCKHLAAVLYVLADQLDDDPWLLTQWRGRTREEIIDTLRPAQASQSASQGQDPVLQPSPEPAAQPPQPPPQAVAPWWPLPPGDIAEPDLMVDRSQAFDVPTGGPTLARLSPLELGGTKLSEVLAPLYDVLGHYSSHGEGLEPIDPAWPSE